MKHQKKSQGSNNGMPFLSPYQNFVFGLLERARGDLIFETRTCFYTPKAQKEAFQFFFDRKSELYDDFLFWCDLANFDFLYWERKALFAVAVKLVKRPKFWINVKRHIKDPKILGKLKLYVLTIKKADLKC